jgi:menaquinol-cytochrome c reductase iron-sulfur subunit
VEGEHESIERMSNGPTEPGATGPDPASAAAAGEPPEEKAVLSRRNFVLRALGVIGGAIAVVLGIPVAGFASAPGWRAKTPARLLSTSVVPTLRSSALTPVGKLADFAVGVPQYVQVDRPIVDGWVEESAPVGVHVVRTSETDVAVFDPHCTHLGCPLAWSPGARSFVCPCHGGSFDGEGRVIGGPPPRPMIRYETQIQDGNVLIGALQDKA